MKILFAISLLVVVVCGSVGAQQTADTAFLPVIDTPTYESGSGPVVMIDEAHNNFHTADGRFLPFAELLRRDGYTVKGSATAFVLDSLKTGDVLVISNALHERNTEEWSLPTPSAFTAEEIETVRQWVEAGGSLFLIADHMPFPGAAADLAGTFGIIFNNGFALDTLKRGPPIFNRTHKTMLSQMITNGRNETERVDSVASFTGQAFQDDNPDFQPLMVLDSGYISLVPDTAWVFNESTEIVPVEGWYQGGVLTYGKGRVAIFGEAAMFTAQKVVVDDEERRAGMNTPVAEQNLQFLLNLMRWLTGTP